jgi:hypothetical protein
MAENCVKTFIPSFMIMNTDQLVFNMSQCRCLGYVKRIKTHISSQSALENLIVARRDKITVHPYLSLIIKLRSFELNNDPRVHLKPITVVARSKA